MRTDDLISALVADSRTAEPPLEKAMGAALLLGAAATLAAFSLLIGPRPDFVQALGTARFVAKFIVVFALAIPAIVVIFRIGRPGAGFGWWARGLALGPVLLALALAGELLAVPSAEWPVRLAGTNARHCMTVIPLLAVAPLAALLVSLRRAAPARPALAGAAAGLVSACIAAAFYAANCTDDSPLFVATWYPLAFAIVIAAGSLLGARLLRW